MLKSVGGACQRLPVWSDRIWMWERRNWSRERETKLNRWCDPNLDFKAESIGWLYVYAVPCLTNTNLGFGKEWRIWLFPTLLKAEALSWKQHCDAASSVTNPTSARQSSSRSSSGTTSNVPISSMIQKLATQLYALTFLLWHWRIEKSIAKRYWHLSSSPFWHL